MILDTKALEAESHGVKGPYHSWCWSWAAPKPSIPADDRMAAIRAGCSAADIHLKCSYPDCSCETTPREIDAAISTLQRLGWKEPGKEEG